MRRIGIDVGGTNTDAVLLDGDKVIFACKRPTTLDVTSGILDALKALRADPVTRGPVDSVVIGTTHFINAVVQRKHLMKVAAIRIGMPVSASLPPFCDWPTDLAEKVHGETFMLEGGHDFDGRPIMPFDTSAMRNAARKIRELGLRSVAVSSIFSPLDPSCEIAARDILQEICPDVAVTMSHDLGRIGLLERENAALLNAVLHDLAVETVAAFRKAIAESGIDAPLFLTQNDGTVMQAETAIAFPVMSFASGATNSMRGAAHLSGREDAMVVDVGGTTSDIGQLRHGFPREANAVVEVGGVRTLFRMPDLLSIGLGGGSHVDTTSAKVGPLSVGYRLTEDALVFGGRQLTATDIAVAAGLLDIGDRARVASLSKELIDAALADARRLLEENIDRMKTEAADALLVAVGGGAFLVPDQLAGVSEIIRVPFGDCANAVGAAIARVSGEADQVFRELSRDDAIAAALQIAEAKAIAGGADPASLKTIEVEDMPIAYLPGNSLRVRVRVAGALAGVATKREVA
jgi:N-methylhydantoinase A/oxoprolinase/acetone carboxylase beta subunit